MKKSYGSTSQVTNGSTDGSDHEHDHERASLPFLPKEDKFTLESSTISWYQSLTFQWFAPLLIRGNNTDQLQPSDLDLMPLPPSCKTSNIVESFDICWKKEIEKCTQRNKNESKNEGDDTTQRQKRQPSLVRALAGAFGRDFIKAGLLKFVHDVCVFVGPNVLHGLIQFTRDPDAPMQDGLWLTLAVTCSQLTMSFCLRHYFFGCYLTGLRIRTAVVISVYKKALVLSSTERLTRKSGEIVNLISIDAQRLQDLTTYLHAVWYSFLQIGLAIYFLWKQLGASCLGGVAVIIIMVPITKFVAAWMGHLQKKLMKARDYRVEVNNEVLGNMKVIKLQAWEQSFQRRIKDLREKELSQLFYYVIGNSFSIMLWTAVPLLVAIATFAAYTLSGNNLDVASALTALALFEILRFPLFMLPQVVNNLVEASISLARVKNFLICEEYHAVGKGDIFDASGIKIEDGTFVYDSKKPKMKFDSENVVGSNEELAKELNDTKWEMRLLRSQLADAEQKLRELAKTEEKRKTSDIDRGLKQDTLGTDEDSPSSMLALRRIDFECKPGELIAIVGAVGSGKSTFINSILGEVRNLSGTISVKGRLAYFPQTPFIMNDTLKNNVIFAHTGDVFEKDRYDRAISICALKHDLELLQNGDETEIGEKGITLSGGQKARVAMARAVYHNADIYLLDDPLAAVDAHVGRHIFQKCIVDELLLGKCSVRKYEKSKKSTVILVTNSIQYLSNPMVDRIFVLEDGCIAEVGTFSDLSTRPHSLFSSFVKLMNDTGEKGNSIDSIRINDSDPSIEPIVPVSQSSLSTLGDGTGESEVTLRMQPKKRQSSSEDTGKEDFNIDSATKTDGNDGGIAASDATPLMTSELQEREKGHVDIGVYMSWARAAGGPWVGIILILAYACVEGINILSKWWLAYWSNNAEEHSQKGFLAIYAGINFIGIFAIFGRVALIMVSGLRASRLLFTELLDVVLRAPMSFFDTTPVGRIVNRFSKDIYTVDEALVSTIRSYLATISTVIGVIVVISSITPLFTACLIPILIFYANQQIYFTKTYRELKRLDSVNRSPIYALLGETLDGVSTIRAYNAELSLLKRIIKMVDLQQNAYFLTCTAQCWLAVRLELVGTLIILFACLCAVLEHHSQGGNESFAGLAGLSISFALSVTQSLNWSVRMGSDLEANMVAVERIRQYSSITSEAPHQLETDKNVNNSWPEHGSIEFSSVKMRYRPGLPLVLKGLNISIPSMSKVGVVGRTGAGKSTLMVSLLRLVELDSGAISIDGIDISRIGLKLLRSKIAVIPQDPVLFSGTVRTNLDPFNEYKDERLNGVLECVGLKSSSAIDRVPSNHSLSSLSGAKSSLPVKSLSDRVLEGGGNFSVGQRQLLVIARALLREAKIVIMDEATASVDNETDSRIQRVMRTEFQNSTCITVAHRINTILDCDYILVMDDGLAVEFDSPHELLVKGGFFKDLVDAWEEEKNNSSESV